MSHWTFNHAIFLMNNQNFCQKSQLNSFNSKTHLYVDECHRYYHTVPWNPCNRTTMLIPTSSTAFPSMRYQTAMANTATLLIEVQATREWESPLMHTYVYYTCYCTFYLLAEFVKKKNIIFSVSCSALHLFNWHVSHILNRGLMS